MDLSVKLSDINEALGVIQEVVRKTPLSFAQSEDLRSQNIYFKQENFQLTGSFKIRGALNRISRLSDEEKKKGVIAASAGNHAQGVAYSAKRFSVSSHIVMPIGAPLIKVERTRAMGAQVTLAGAYFDEAYEKARKLSQVEGRVFIHPYQDPFVVAGQGTIGLEILQDLPSVKNIVVPIGGGGLIGGIASAIKLSAPHVKVFGVVTEQTPGMLELKKGVSPSTQRTISTIADGIAVKNPSPVMYEKFIEPYVDDIFSVSDEEIAQAIVHLLEDEKSVVEGSGAAGLAAVLSGKITGEGPTCVVLCGGNIDLNTVSSVIDTGLRRQGRLTRISTIVDDLPGLLAEMTTVFAKGRANILDVHHDRVSPELRLRQTRIDFLLETIDSDHVRALQAQLEEKGVRVLREEEGCESAQRLNL